jgi:tetratricopeptide (TPR) repeat protein
MTDRDDVVHTTVVLSELGDLLDRAHRLLCACKYKEALTVAHRAVKLAPQCLEAWRELGSACGSLQRVEEMESAFERALWLATTPWDESRTWYYRGNAENDAGAWDAALRSFSRLAELEPDWGHVWVMRAMVLENMGQFRGDRRYYEDALVALDHALEALELSAIDESMAYSRKEQLLSCLGRYEEAEWCRRKAAEIRLAHGTSAAPRPRVH